MPSDQIPTSNAHPKILVVDDEPLLLKLLSRILSAYDVTTLQRADEARRLIEQGARFDIIFSDLLMPAMTGIELYEWTQGFDAELSKRFVFLSGGAATEKIHEFLLSVPIRCVDKPFDVTALRALVQDMLSPTDSVDAPV